MTIFDPHSVRAALRWAVTIGLLPVSPKIERPKRSKSNKMMKGRPITTEEFERMLGKVPAVVGDKSASAWRYYLRGLWLSGLRLTLVAYCNDDSFTESITVTVSRQRLAYIEALVERWPALDTEEHRQHLRLALEAIATEALRSPIDRGEVSNIGPEDYRALAEQALARTPNEIRAEAESMLNDENLLKLILDDAHDLGIAGEREMVATLYIVGTSRLLKKPLSAIVQGTSSSGKSYLIDGVAKLFPPEAVIMATTITPQALHYMPLGSLQHRWVVAGERSRREDDDTAEATRALREMISAGRLSKLMPIKDGASGGLRTRMIEQEGPIAYVESTTLTSIFDEDANRCILVTTDERPQQTSKIVDAAARQFAGKSKGNSIAIRERHFALQRLLKQFEVVVPFAENIGRHFDASRVEARRAFPHLLRMVQAVALLHQRQRTFDDQGRLIATIEDYQLAHRLLMGPIGRLIGDQASPPSQRFFEDLKQLVGLDKEFTTTDVIKAMRKRAKESAIRSYLNELDSHGLVKQTLAASGSRPAQWLIPTLTEGQGNWTGLPDVQTILAEHEGEGADKPQLVMLSEDQSTPVNLGAIAD